jgi:hypothetical protein
MIKNIEKIKFSRSLLKKSLCVLASPRLCVNLFKFSCRHSLFLAGNAADGQTEKPIYLHHKVLELASISN